MTHRTCNPGASLLRHHTHTHLLMLVKLMCAAHIHVEGSLEQLSSQLVSCSLVVDAPCVQGARRRMVCSAWHVLKPDKACLEQLVQQLLGLLYASPSSHQVTSSCNTPASIMLERSTAHSKHVALCTTHGTCGGVMTSFCTTKHDNGSTNCSVVLVQTCSTGRVHGCSACSCATALSSIHSAQSMHER